MKKNRYLLPDGTEKFTATPRHEGTYLYFTSSGDDIVNGVVGTGNKLVIDNTDVNQDISRSVECQFLDTIYLKDGLAMWENANIGDSIKLEVVLPANTAMPMENKDGNASLIDGVVTIITASPTPDVSWVGEYLLLPVDYVVNRFVNGVHLLGSNTTGYLLESQDAVEIPNIFKIRFEYTNDIAVNPNFKIVITLECYRKRTV